MPVTKVDKAARQNLDDSLQEAAAGPVTPGHEATWNSTFTLGLKQRNADTFDQVGPEPTLIDAPLE